MGTVFEDSGHAPLHVRSYVLGDFIGSAMLVTIVALKVENPHKYDKIDIGFASKLLTTRG